MKGKMKIFIIVLVTGGLIGGFLVWRNYKVVEKKYQACREKCMAKQVSRVQRYGGWDELRYDKECLAECKEKYGK